MSDPITRLPAPRIAFAGLILLFALVVYILDAERFDYVAHFNCVEGIQFDTAFKTRGNRSDVL